MEYKEKLMITSFIDEHVFKEIADKSLSDREILEKLIDHINELTRLKKKIWDE